LRAWCGAGVAAQRLPSMRSCAQGDRELRSFPTRRSSDLGEAFTGIAGPLGQASDVRRHRDDQTVVFTAGGLGLPPVYPIMREHLDRKSTRLNSSHVKISYAVFCLKEKKNYVNDLTDSVTG